MSRDLIRVHALAALLVAGMMCHSSPLDAQRVSAVGVEVDNDLFTTFDVYAASDYEYTHGIRLWLELTRSPGFLHSMDKLLLPACSHRPDACATRLQLGQEMYTPRIESSGDPLPGQRPHAGWLYASASRAARMEHVETEYELQIGVIGPPAMAEQTQKTIHKIFGMRVPQGWESQLPTEPTLQLRVQRSAVVASTSVGSLTPALGYSVDSEAGNALVQTSAGLTAALCYNRSCGANEFDRNGKLSARVVAAGGPRLVLHNTFLDGGIREPATSVERRNVVWLGSAGVAFRWRRFVGEFERVFRGREYETEPDGFSYGTFRLAIKW